MIDKTILNLIYHKEYINIVEMAEQFENIKL